jgi:hypothetical protein
MLCPKCGRIGSVVWEDVPGSATDRAHRELIGIQGGFYERLSAKSPYPIELVCDSCGTVQE